MANAAVQYATYAAIRSLIGATTVLSPGTMIRAAGLLGRTFGGLSINRKRFERGVEHLGVAFPEWTMDQRRRCALAAYEHLLTLGAELAYAPRLLCEDVWMRHLGMTDVRPVVRHIVGSRPCLLVTAHCGNWELLGYILALLGFPTYAIYRPLDLKPLDAWVRRTRERRGLVLVDKFGAMRRLPGIVSAGAPVGFIADQNGGDRGIFVPYFGRLASTYKSIGLTALEFNATVLCGFARRLGPDERMGAGALGQLEWDSGSSHFRYVMELQDVIRPEDWRSFSDPLYYITARFRHAIEQMVRRAPEQYLWMHRIWKSRPRHERLGRPFPPALEKKIRELPWISDADWERIRAHSEADAAVLAASYDGAAGGA